MNSEPLYKELIVWQKSMEFVDWVYAMLKTFPREENYRLCDQLARAVVSIPSNIAEGNGRNSKSDFARFLSIARGSLYETMTQLEIAKRQGYINDLTQAEEYANSIRKMLNSLITKLIT
ncbi:MAG: four helix bundle protein [Kiritimatiellae bacterium]|nr:four helix bundle protein [Kiritimatiellia bacterium]MBR6587237.1 four helix bundle protein [Kiritimatiellia bacterium]